MLMDSVIAGDHESYGPNNQPIESPDFVYPEGSVLKLVFLEHNAIVIPTGGKKRKTIRRMFVFPCVMVKTQGSSAKFVLLCLYPNNSDM